MTSDERRRSLQILDRLADAAPPDNAKLANYVAALRAELAREDLENEEKAKLLAEYEEAYQKLTAPANRMGVFLERLESGLALIAVGDTEFLAQLDPTIEPDSLARGDRVYVNDAYAVVGRMDPHPGGALMKVAEAYDDGRLRLGTDGPSTDGGRIVLRAQALAERKLETGDLVRVEPTGRVAVEAFEQKENRDYFFEEVPEIPWEKIGGQDDAIRLIKDTIEKPLLYPDVYLRFEKKPIKGMLLYGPPGCGKTLIGKATAYNLTQEYSKRVGHAVKEYFMYISGPKILNMWLGETERMVRDIFRIAREKAKEGRLVFIFMDEAESVLRTRSSGRYLNISNTVVPQFCAELDGLVSLENVVLMLTSNRPDYIDPAVLRPERIDRKVKVNRPDRAATTQILGIYLHAGIPLDPGALAEFGGEVDCARQKLVESLTERLWSHKPEYRFLKVMLRNGATETLYRSDLASGALLKSIVDRAKDFAIERAIQEPDLPHGVSLADLERAAEAEYRENEIFPKTDTQEDWLKLLDYEPENVAAVRPILRHRGEEMARKNIV